MCQLNSNDNSNNSNVALIDKTANYTVTEYFHSEI